MSGRPEGKLMVSREGRKEMPPSGWSPLLVWVLPPTLVSALSGHLSSPSPLISADGTHTQHLNPGLSPEPQAPHVTQHLKPFLLPGSPHLTDGAPSPQEPSHCSGGHLSVPTPTLPYGPSISSSAPLLPRAHATCFLDSAKMVLELLPNLYLTPLIHCAHYREISLPKTLVRLALEKSQTLPPIQLSICPPPSPDKSPHVHRSPPLECPSLPLSQVTNSFFSCKLWPEAFPELSIPTSSGPHVECSPLRQAPVPGLAGSRRPWATRLNGLVRRDKRSGRPGTPQPRGWSRCGPGERSGPQMYPVLTPC